VQVWKNLAFTDDGKPIGVFGDDPRISDPRGLGIDPVDGLLFVNSGSNRILALDRNGQIVRASRAIQGLNPGGGNLGPDGRYYVGLRGERSIMAFARQLDRPGEYILPPHVVPFPRGFAFGADGTLFLASGIGPGGEGDNTILAFDSDRQMLSSWKVRDPELSPLDLAIAPSGNVVVSSEHPFGAPNAVTTIREYDRADRHLVQVLVPANASRAAHGYEREARAHAQGGDLSRLYPQHHRQVRTGAHLSPRTLEGSRAWPAPGEAEGGIRGWPEAVAIVGGCWAAAAFFIALFHYARKRDAVPHFRPPLHHRLDLVVDAAVRDRLRYDRRRARAQGSVARMMIAAEQAPLAGQSVFCHRVGRHEGFFGVITKVVTPANGKRFVIVRDDANRAHYREIREFKQA